MKPSVKSKHAGKQQAILVQEGIAAAKAGKKDEAEALLTRAVEQDPTQEIAWLWLAYISKDVNRTITFLRRVLALNTENAQARTSLTKALLQRGIAYAKAGENLLARESLSEAASNSPRDEAAWLWLASVAENTAKMTSHLQKVLDLNPQNERAITWLKSLGQSIDRVQKLDGKGGAKEIPVEERPAAAASLDSPEESDFQNAATGLTQADQAGSNHPPTVSIDLAGPIQSEALLALPRERTNESSAETPPVELKAEFTELENFNQRQTRDEELMETGTETGMGTELELVSDVPVTEVQANTTDRPSAPDDLQRRLTMSQAEVLDLEARWRRESDARIKAEQYAEELQQELYRSMNLRREAERLNLKADVAIRDSELLRIDLRELQEKFQSAEELRQQETAAREAAELRVKQIEEESERTIQEKITAIAGSGVADAVAREEALAKARAAEAWVQELNGKWQEEIAAREAAEKRVKELEEELTRTQTLLHEAELAWTKVEVQKHDAPAAQNKIEQSLEDSEKHIARLEERLAEVVAQLEVESQNRVKAENKLRKVMEEKSVRPMRYLAMSDTAFDHKELMASASQDDFGPIKPMDGESRIDSTLPGSMRFTDSQGIFQQKSEELDSKATLKMILFVLIVSASLFSLGYVTYILLQNAQ